MPVMKTIIVLGMHRSATSMTARALHKSGEVYMGTNLMLNGFDNPEGHYENYDFYYLNEDILKVAGGSWFNPPAHEQIMAVEPLFRHRIQTLVSLSKQKAAETGYRSWGWKDPRTVLTIDLYMPHLDKPQFVTCHRDNGEVAASLLKIHGLEYQKAYNLSIEYNKRLLKFLSKL
jgi:hypothetical protein